MSVFSRQAQWIAGAVGVIAGLLSFFAAKRADGTQQRALDVQMVGLQKQIKAAREAAEFSAEKEQEKVRIQTALDFTGKMLDLRLKQSEQFYAPLLAYCRQLRGLRQKLELYLAKTYPREYRLDGERLEVAVGANQWVDFRMLDRLPALKKDQTAKELCQKVLEIDASMVEVIQKQNGLAGVGHEISPVYGQFLAHFVILKLVFDDARSEPYPPGWHERGYYPRELDAVIEKGYSENWKAVQKYQLLSDDALTSLARKEVK